MASTAARRGVPPNAAAARGAVGTAVPRPPVDYRYVYVSHPFYGPWGYWYPWYGSGFGWYSGYIGYNPYWYAATYWGFGRYGFWYDPFSYAYGPDLGYSGGGGSGESKSERTTGSIRLKVSPSSAKVYIDGALHGTADDFDGFSDHLELPAGRQTIELRAEGYETKRVDIDVSAGKTLTERITLKKLK